MKFDLLYELQIPKPHDARSEWRAYKQALEQIELADRLGFDTVWAVEHHFLVEFAHSSAPEVCLAAAAQRTKRIRIGHGVVLLPSKFNHPIRVAERAAALDLVSDGRLEFGTGRSSQYEQAGFEIDTELSRDMWQESLEIVPRMWTEDPFEFHGRFVNIPSRSIVPKPLQQPHPPIWMAATSPQSWEIAGRNGIGILGLTIFVSVPQLQERVRAYRAALKQAKPVGKCINDQVRAFTTVHVAGPRQRRSPAAPPTPRSLLAHAFASSAAARHRATPACSARRPRRRSEHAVSPDRAGPDHRQMMKNECVRGSRSGTW
jgi:alkanesulfonate monooxygenase SsuD/methylene tetrahydromethanopterin reductase-like flavin-dependent oxidoreductase (luciferase family)